MFKKNILIILSVVIVALFSTSPMVKAQELVNSGFSNVLVVNNFGDYVDIRIPLKVDSGVEEELPTHLPFLVPIETAKLYLASGLLKDVQDSRISNVYVSNKSLHNFYLTQHDTGAFSFINCMPASVASVVKWINPESKWTVEQIRNKLSPRGGNIYTDQVSGFFNDVGVRYSIKPLYKNDLKRSYNVVLNALNAGSIIMTCSDMGEISYSYDKSQSNLGKSYLADFKHSFLITGYILLEDEVFFEVFDPYDKIVGVRYMRGKEVIDSITSHWSYIFEVPRQKLGFD